MSDEEIRVFREGYLGIVELNRPKRQNAFTWKMYDILSDAMDRHEDLGPQPAIKRFQFRPPRMARNVNLALPVGDHDDAPLGQPGEQPQVPRLGAAVAGADGADKGDIARGGRPGSGRADRPIAAG